MSSIGTWDQKSFHFLICWVFFLMCKYQIFRSHYYFHHFSWHIHLMHYQTVNKMDYQALIESLKTVATVLNLFLVVEWSRWSWKVAKMDFSLTFETVKNLKWTCGNWTSRFWIQSYRKIILNYQVLTLICKNFCRWRKTNSSQFLQCLRVFLTSKFIFH